MITEVDFWIFPLIVTQTTIELIYPYQFALVNSDALNRYNNAEAVC